MLAYACRNALMPQSQPEPTLLQVTNTVSRTVMELNVSCSNQTMLVGAPTPRCVRLCIFNQPTQTFMAMQLATGSCQWRLCYVEPLSLTW